MNNLCISHSRVTLPILEATGYSPHDDLADAMTVCDSDSSGYSSTITPLRMER